MKVSFNRAALAEALGIVTSAVANRTPKPILRCVKIATDEKLVKICATDLEVGINYALSQVQIDKLPQFAFLLYRKITKLDTSSFNDHFFVRNVTSCLMI